MITPSCINPDHLLIGTHQDNQDDKVSRGRQVKGVDVHTVVLTPQQVCHIRTVYKPRDRVYGASALARLYGVHNTTINRLVNNKTWRSI